MPSSTCTILLILSLVVCPVAPFPFVFSPAVDVAMVGSVDAVVASDFSSGVLGCSLLLSAWLLVWLPFVVPDKGFSRPS